MVLRKLLLSFLFLGLIISPSLTFADGPYLNIPPTNAFDKIRTDSGSISAVNFSMPVIIKGGTGVTVTGNNGTHTVTITNTQAINSHTGTYNQTLANNIVKNSGGQGLNFINGTGNPINLVNDPTRNQINITISTGGGVAGVTSLNALVGALTIACVQGNTTCTTSGGNTITINTAYNIVTTGLSAQTITKGLTLNALTLGGNAVGGNKNFTGLADTNATRFFQNGKQVLDTLTQGAGISITGSGNSRTITNTGVLSAITSVNSQTGPSISIVRELGNTTITNSTNQIKVGLGVNPVITGGAAQTITKPIKLNQLNASSSLVDNNDNTKKLTWLLSGMTTGKTLTVRSNQTTSQGLNIPNISGTDTLGTLGLSQIWTGANTYSPTTTQGIIMNPPTVPVGSSTSFTGNIKQNNSTTAFATNPETGDYASNNFGQVTLTNPSSGTIPVAATLEIAGAPIAGSNVIITNPFALLVDSGTSRFVGDIYGIGKWNINSNTNANNDILNVNDNYGITSIVGFYTQAVHNIYYSAGWKSRQGGPGGLIEMDGGASQGQGMLFQLTNGTTGTAKGHPLTLSTILGLGTTGVSNFLGVNTAGLGIQPIYNATNQKSESGADPNVLTYTPPATKGNYEIKITMSVSAASSATLGWTASWKDSNGHAQAPTNLSLTKSGTAAPALTFTAAANDVYYAVLPIDTDNSATKIIVKTTFAGTSTAYKVSATIEQIQ